MKTGEYVMTEDTGAITRELYGSSNEKSNSEYFLRLQQILAGSGINLTVKAFEEQEIEAELSKQVVSVLETDPSSVVLIVDRFLCRNLDDEYEGRIKRFSITRRLDGEKISRASQPTLDSQIELLKQELGEGRDTTSVYIADDGFFSGGTINDLSKVLTENGMTVAGAIGFLSSGDASLDIPVWSKERIPELIEWIDIRDYGVFGGKINRKSRNGQIATAVPYIAPWSDGSAASLDRLPDFFDVSRQVIEAQQELLRSYDSPLTIRDLARRAFALPVAVDGSMPFTINMSMVDYLENCKNAVENESRRDVIVLDMDGTLYTLIGSGGYGESELRQQVEQNALSFINTLVTDENADDVLKAGLTDPVGISAYLEREYGILRQQYFDQVWDINPADYIVRNEELEAELRQVSGGKFGSEKQKLVLLTASPRAWAKKIIEYLGLKDVFETVYTGEMYGSKSEIFDILSGRYSAENVTSIGDQLGSDIAPATAIGMNGILVSGPDQTLEAIREIKR